MKKMMKRLCRFQAADITWPFMMHRVWCNDRNRQNYKLWLRGLRPAYWDVLSNLAIETIKGANEMGLKNNLEKWAI